MKPGRNVDAGEELNQSTVLIRIPRGKPSSPVPAGAVLTITTACSNPTLKGVSFRVEESLRHSLGPSRFLAGELLERES